MAPSFDGERSMEIMAVLLTPAVRAASWGYGSMSVDLVHSDRWELPVVGVSSIFRIPGILIVLCSHHMATRLLPKDGQRVVVVYTRHATRPIPARVIKQS